MERLLACCKVWRLLVQFVQRGKTSNLAFVTGKGKNGDRNRSIARPPGSGLHKPPFCDSGLQRE